MTFKEQIKIDNFREHLKVLKRDIDIANKTLSEILKKNKESIETSQKNLNDLAILSASKKAEVDNLIGEIKIRNKDADDRDNKLTIRENKIKEENKKLEDSLTLYSEKINKLNAEESVLTHDIKLLQTSKDEIIADLESAKSKLEEILDESAEAMNRKYTIEKSLKEMEAKMEKQTKEIQLSISEKMVELSKIEEKILDEKEKIVLPKRNLELLRDEIDKKQNNLNILVARFRKEFKKLHPDLEPKI